MVSSARLEQMNGFYKAAVEPVIPSSPVLCGCGKPTTHRGMCSARWAKRKANVATAASVALDTPVFDFDTALVADRPRMLRMAMSWTRNDQAAAEDLVQQAAIQILQNKDKFVAGSNFPAWSTTIIKHLFFDSKRREKNTVSITQESSDDNEFEIVEPALTTQPTQESAIVARDMAAAVLADTSPKQREALLRVNMDGQSLEEAADGMGVPEGTIKSLMSRGRDRIDPERKARVIPSVSRQNADSLDFVLQKLREERDRITTAIAALEQCRTIFAGSR